MGSRSVVQDLSCRRNHFYEPFVAMMWTLVVLLSADAFVGADAQLKDYIQFRHRHHSEYCLAALDPDQTGTGVGALSMRKCAVGNTTQEWNNQGSDTMVSEHMDESSGQNPCVSLIGIMAGQYVLSYSYSDCLAGFEV